MQLAFKISILTVNKLLALRKRQVLPLSRRHTVDADGFENEFLGFGIKDEVQVEDD